MAQQWIKQPNGKYALWVSNTDSFLFIDATVEEIADYVVREQVKDFRDDLIEKIKKIVSKLDNNEKPYYQFTLSLEDALKRMAKVHGQDKVDELLEDTDSLNQRL